MFRSRILSRKTPTFVSEPPINNRNRISLLVTNNQQVSVASHRLSPDSKWLVVRTNIHKIRSWGVPRRWSIVNQPFRNWYLFSRIRRELKRVEEDIRAVQYQPNFRPVQHFVLPRNDTTLRTFDVSHVRSTDGIFYADLSSKPIVLEYLLYYFSEESIVPYNSLFYWFLYDVSSVLDTNRQRLQRVVVLRRVASIIALTIFLFILIMLIFLIFSFFTTISNLREMYHKDSKATFLSVH